MLPSLDDFSLASDLLVALIIHGSSSGCALKVTTKDHSMATVKLLLTNILKLRNAAAAAGLLVWLERVASAACVCRGDG